MTNLCPVCAKELSGGRFCPSCGAEAPSAEQAAADEAAQADPFLGRVIQDRYEIIDLINVGGMGRVYKGRHRTLDRTIAIKFIHPHLLTADVVVQRFMVEAQTASQLNHPNVISIFDFGRTAPSEGGDLFIVMEFLAGSDLATILYNEPPMAFTRIAEVLGQTLAALGEAHQLGITHRDVKPENVILEPKRGGGDRVKVIDFGIAKLGGGPKLTTAGEIIGTPSYMAPEQVKGGAVGPGADLYAIGVILFEMLTGQLPFDGATPTEILLKTLGAPRPDPREIAPDRGITPALAAACIRAMDVDPAKRFESADAFAKAIEAAIVETPSWSQRSSTIPPAPLSADRARPSAPQPPLQRSSDRPSGRQSPTPPLRRSEPPSSMPPPAPRSSDRARPSSPQAPPPLRRSEPPVSRPESSSRISIDPTARISPAPPRVTEAPPAPLVIGAPPAPPPSSQRAPESRALVGRTKEIDWARPLLAESADALCMALWGRAGSGRSRLLRELAAIAEDGGAVVRRTAGEPPPYGTVSSAGLRSMIRALFAGHDDRIANDAPPIEAQGLRAIFLGEAPPHGAARRSTSAALAWAVRTAVAAARKRVVLCVDDADLLDGASRAAIEDLLVEEGLEHFLLIATCKTVPEGWFLGAVHQRRVQGLSSSDAGRMLGGARGLRAPLQDELTPLYLEQLLRWHAGESVEQTAPPQIEAVIEWRMRSLSPTHRRVLHVLAVTGGGPAELVSAVLRPGDDLVSSLDPLVTTGFVEIVNGVVRLAHVVFAEVAIAIAPHGALAEVHARAANALAGQSGVAERRAYHAIRGRADLDAFLLVEDAARARAAQGDDDGAIALLEDGLRAARTGMLRGDAEATSGCLVFGQKLGAVLSNAARLTEANGVLTEVLELAGPSSIDRALILEQLAVIADRRDRPSEAESRRREALAIAERAGNRASAERSGQPVVRRGSGAVSNADGAGADAAPSERRKGNERSSS